MKTFTQVDVFTDTLMYGNPVAVVHDADDLTDEQMAAFARWTNLSETTFLLSPTDESADYRLRIFTPGSELPFAGHPTLGSARAWLNAGNSSKVMGQLVQECAAGLINIRQEHGRLAFAAPPLIREGPVDPAIMEQVTRSLGIDAESVQDAQWIDNGPGWIGILLKDASDVLALEPDFEAMADLAVGVTASDTSSHEGIVTFVTRAFAPGDGVNEDPVTGSLNAGFACWLMPKGIVPERYQVRQGSRMGRDGIIHIHLDGEIWVGGDTVIGISGQVAL